ncbi:MAG: carbamoyltransferase HypF [Methanomassiliicoccales archaeon]
MKITVRGIVQGVGFRPTVHRIATAMGLSGYVQNNGSNVAIEVDRDADEFVSALKAQLPPLARIDSISVEEGLPSDSLANGFRIIPSGSGQKGVGIPNDVAVCRNCRRDMFDRSNPRFLYPFTNCTDCGARFTVIEDLPYDREMTSMREFPMCDDCRREYEDPSDRRFHHQTISCWRCGPRFRLLDADGEIVEGEPISTFAALLEDGAIGVAKGWGGMHLCSTLSTLRRLRHWCRRKEKPFAVMVRDMEAVARYARPTEFEKKLLASSHRPIVIVDKIESEVTELISPGLGNVGLFLPYTGMHNLLFHHLSEDALVMTSANVPGEPMVLKDEDALELGAEYYLLHDRRIVNRCDDSVLRTYGDKTFFLRKSRGDVPSSIPFEAKGTAIGVGPQENIAGALAFAGRIHQTQYLGDGSSYGVIEFLESALDYHMRLLGVKDVQAIGMDMHPAYTTRRLASRLAEKHGAELIEVQHHWAHAAALMAESGRDEMVALTLDGTGYGDDGVAWGGEVLHATFERYERVGHLQEIPLIGGERAVYDVRRLAFAIRETAGLPYDEGLPEAPLLRKIMPSSPKTTSLGRLLDAVASELGVCSYRSYDGEPAMKLERHLEKGIASIPIEIKRHGGTIQTVPMYAQMVRSRGTPDDKARSLVTAVLEGLVDIAVDRASSAGLREIGITGGVSYNRTITATVEALANRRGFALVCPDNLPNGDGGIATGQCAVALGKLGMI